ncbi:CynX/NimT family MFS transporter [Sporosarcina siberiensis]|uniref:CynX/NimT family MFS transporter n=1 Tax=Sporosarcina siberiensis TaxID=1365606 RepID=A0ABW4SFY0_9BACL
MNKTKDKQLNRPRVGFFIIGIILLASSLRAPVTSVGPLVGMIREGLGISNTTVGMLTMLPLLAFALVSPMAAKISRKFGRDRTIFFSLIVLTFGIILRSMNGIETFLLGTVLLGFAIAIGNVLLPAIIKESFVTRIGLMTGVYAASMNLSSAIASGITVPLASISWLGWQGALGAFGLLSLTALLFWIPKGEIKATNEENSDMNTKKSSGLWKSTLAWKITLFMGLQSLIFYSIIAWFPEILQQKGMTAASAGWMIALMQFTLLPFTFIIPIIAGKMESQRLLVAMTAGLFFLGISGVTFSSPVLIPLWMISIGIASGSAFSLSMMFFGLKTRNSNEAAEMSGMAQSVGYLLAAFGPLLFGLLKDVTGDWTTPLAFLMATSVLLFIFGMGAGKKIEI